MTRDVPGRFRRKVLGLQVRVWAIAGVAFVIGVVIGLMLWVIAARPKVDWSWSGWPTIIALITLGGILATATGTVVLAWKTSDLASATEQMATAALQEAETTARSVELQREELEAVKTQAKLTEDQLRLATDEFQTTRLAARPLLEVNLWPVTPGLLNARIIWVRGTEPAFDVQVWVKLPDGTYLHPLGTLPAGTGVDQTGIRTDIAATELPWPFPEADDDETLGAHDFLAGVVWRSADDFRGQHLIRCVAIERPDNSLPKERRYYVVVPTRIEPPSLWPEPENHPLT